MERKDHPIAPHTLPTKVMSRYHLSMTQNLPMRYGVRLQKRCVVSACAKCRRGRACQFSLIKRVSQKALVAADTQYAATCGGRGQRVRGGSIGMTHKVADEPQRILSC